MRLFAGMFDDSLGISPGIDLQESRLVEHHRNEISPVGVLFRAREASADGEVSHLAVVDDVTRRGGQDLWLGVRIAENVAGIGQGRDGARLQGLS